MGLHEDLSNKTIKINNDEYNLYSDFYGNSPKSLMWMTKGSQNANFKLISKHIKNEDTLLDYGCGNGDLITYLKKHNIKVSKYFGVDINENFIDMSKNNHPDYNFELIDSINDVKGKYDIVCAIGVFTWFIPKKEFIEIINKLYSISDKQLLLTLLKGETPYSNENYTSKNEDKYWNKEYRFYDENLFNELFPNLNISYEYDNLTMLVNIKK